MLTINSIECVVGDAKGTGAAARYVLNEADQSAALARSAYYAGEGGEDDSGDAGPLWHGHPAALAQLGLTAVSSASRVHLERALQGQHVETGAQVRRPGQRTVERDDGTFVVERVVKSVDLAFSVPKSVSVVWSQASPEERRRIEADVLVAARETLDFMATAKACVHRRNETGERIREPAAGIAAALSLHVTARRAEDDYAPAPQLHVHGVVVGVLRKDGRLVTPDSWNWFRDNGAREGGALGRAVLADRLEARGYEIEPETGKKHRYFEIAGVPESLREALSGRSREVAVRAKALELATGRPVHGPALAVLAKETRQAKDDMPQDQIASWWDALATEHGFGPREAAALARPRTREATGGERKLAESILRRLADEGPTVSTTEARAIALESAAGRTTPQQAMQVLDRLQQLGLVIALEQDRVTTQPVRELERRVLLTARAAARQPAEPLAHQHVAAGVAAAEEHLGPGARLDDEQRAAVAVLSSGAGWTCLLGRAGTGKGPTLEAVAHAHRAAGFDVIACAVDGTTAQRLAAQVQGPGYTIDGLTTRIRNGLLAPSDGTLVIVDEASKVDTARWAHLADLVDRAGARVISIGDPGQLAAVHLPGLFTELCRVTKTVELTEVRRHRDPEHPDRIHPWLGRYQAALHRGDGRTAVALLQEHEAIRLHDTRAEAMVALVDDWNTWRHQHPLDQTLLLVHGTNGDVDTINLLAQQRRLAAGELGNDSVAAPDRDYRLHAGDRVILRGAPLRLATGARIENGTSMTVLGVDAARDRIDVDLDAGPRTTIELNELRTATGQRRPALRLAYAMHPSPAQGATVDRTAAIGHPVADRNATYVADTRARYHHTVHLAREDLGDGTDQDRLNRYAASLSDARTREASTRYQRDPSRRLGREL